MMRAGAHQSMNQAMMGGQTMGNMAMRPFMASNADCNFEIREVWANNLEQEMAEIRRVLQNYPYVAMDTEFPGVVAKPMGNFRTKEQYNYQLLRANVDLLRIIQLGLTFANEHGELPKGCCTWQFNFRFSLATDMYAQDSIELLQRSGIDFDRHDAEGIDIFDFGELLATSGLSCNENVKWVSFHSGYDFGYLLQVLLNQPMPPAEEGFFEIMSMAFPCVYDIKYLIVRGCKSLKGGLQDVADELKVERIGPQHQAGSDSLLTILTFFAMRAKYFDNFIEDAKYMGHLFGLGINSASAAAAAAAAIASSGGNPYAAGSGPTSIGGLNGIGQHGGMPSNMGPVRYGGWTPQNAGLGSPGPKHYGQSGYQ
eukprot:Clim_evm93s134 gene=Clim_evmTU93s134